MCANVYALKTLLLNISCSFIAYGTYKAGYMASSVACGWAGAVFDHLGMSSEVILIGRKTPKIFKCDGLTDGPTER